MKIDYLKTLNAVELLDYYVHYLKNREKYSPEDREILDQYFEED